MNCLFPVKLQSLRLRNSSLHAVASFDPRPKNRLERKKYQEHFQNVCANSRGDIVLRQLLPPANIEAVCLDHDYCRGGPPQQRFLDGINVTAMSEAERHELELATRGQSSCKRWKEERKKRLHASNFGRICHQQSKLDNLAISLVDPKEFSCPAVEHGRRYESVALDSYEEEVKRNLKRRCGIYVSKEHSFLACSPDAVDGDILVEVKCPYSAKDSMVDESLNYLELIDGKLSLKKAHNYFFQIQGSLFCTGLSRCNFVVWTKKDFVIIPIARDDVFISDMVTKLISFFEMFFKPALLNRLLFRNYSSLSF